MGRRVVVIGSGAAGLVATKENLECGSEVICLEKSHVVGGVFSTLEESSYEGLYLTTSNVFMSFGDFPWQHDKMRYAPKAEYAEYLNLYAKHFDLFRHIRFGTTVKKVRKLGEWDWVIETSDKEGNQKEYRADAVVVCTGGNSVPKPIDSVAPGFTGEKIHSLQFHSPAPYKNKTVMVIGTGESATDISSDLATVAKETVVWARRPFLIAPRFPEKILNEPDHDEYAIMRDESAWSKIPIADHLEFINTSRITNIQCLALWGFLRQSFWKVTQTSKWAAPAFKAAAAWSMMIYKTMDDPKLRSRAYWAADQVQFATKNSRIASVVAKGKVKLIISKDATFTENSVKFHNVIGEDVSYFDSPQQRTFNNIDTIICCVGYKTDFSFLDAEALNISFDPRSWYKHCFPPGHDASLAFIGYARGHQGGIPQLAEMIARYHALVIAEKRQLPPNYADLTRQEAKAETDYFFLSPHLRTLVDYPSFCDSIARLIGCMPRMPNPLWSPIMFIKYWMYPLWACWYRLRGPGANPKAANLVLKDRFPLSKLGTFAPPPYFIMILLCPFTKALSMLSRVLHLDTSKGRIGRGYLWNRSKLYVLHSNNCPYF